ncbi:MAG: toll/interleukin-1 receptor domain-containing protein [Ignavibacteria bacterium]|jgi:hypothetical protein
MNKENEKMKVFISWSGKRSHQAAEALHELIPLKCQLVKTWLASEDIPPGKLWSEVLKNELRSNDMGILCITEDNINSDWLLFEAGALSQSPISQGVIPYLIGIENNNLPGPLSQYQALDSDERGTKKLFRFIFEKSKANLSSDQQNKIFNKFWPELNNRINDEKILDTEDCPKEISLREEKIKSLREICDEILNKIAPLRKN